MRISDWSSDVCSSDLAAQRVLVRRAGAGVGRGGQPGTRAHEPVFYRKDRPKLIDEYRARQHRHFTTSRNIVENIVHDMPGVPARNTALDFLEGMFPGN